jgi:uncharacterized protein YbjT (DUF2867 family)
MRILVTGATGYIGGRLIPKLLEKGHQVRVLVRDPERIAGRDWAARVKVHTGDLLQPESLDKLCADIDAAYYLVHSMDSGSGYTTQDRLAATNFIAAAGETRLVIYLGGLLPQVGTVSPHLRSRAEVGELLRSHLPTTEFRAGPIIGSGSASFEMVRYLTERLPIMITPRWIENEVQPIAVRDILAYLIAALDRPPLGVVAVGTDPLTFRMMMIEFAHARKLRRWIYGSPVLAPWLAARWIGLVTPLSNRIAVPLVQSIISPVVQDTSEARKLFPEIEPLTYRVALDEALLQTRSGQVETRWSGALGRGPTYRLTDVEGLAREERSLTIDLPPEAVARSFMSIGGDRGWLVWKWAWAIRGLMDMAVGGPGLRRGRRHPTRLLAGEALDFWRVEVADPPRMLRLRAEMRLPGKAWLQWETHPEGKRTRLVQTALFAPRGFIGFAYWYSLYPIHKFIFNDMIRAIARDAKEMARKDSEAGK